MIENHVVNLELSKRLKELLGLRKTLFYYHDKSNNDIENYEILYKDFVGIDVEAYETIQRLYPAYLASELGEMLPDELIADTASGKNKPLSSWHRGSMYFIGYQCENGMFMPVAVDPVEANARAVLLIHLIEQKLITI